MTGPIAQCDHCGLIYQSTSFEFIQSNITLTGCKETCPRCGSMANILERRFSFISDNIIVKDAPQKTIDIINTLKRALESAKEGLDESSIVYVIAKESPELGKIAKSALKKNGLRGLLLLIISLLASCSASVQQSLDWNMLVDQAHVYMTGEAPYPFGENHIQAQADDKPREHLSRQQRRQQERQSKKQQKPAPQMRKTKKSAPHK